MQEKELIRKIKELREIKPSQDWVILAKSRILGQEPEYKASFASLSLFAWPKVAMAGLILLLAGLGFVTISNYSSVVEIAKNDIKEAREDVALLQGQVDDLEQVIRLASAEAARQISEIDIERTSPQEFNKVVIQANKIIEDAEKMKTSLGVLGVGSEIDVSDLALATEGIVKKSNDKVNAEEIISVLENQLEFEALSQEQEELLVKMKELFLEGNYSEALELFFANQAN